MRADLSKWRRKVFCNAPTSGQHRTALLERSVTVFRLWPVLVCAFISQTKLRSIKYQWCSLAEWRRSFGVSGQGGYIIVPLKLVWRHKLTISEELSCSAKSDGQFRRHLPWGAVPSQPGWLIRVRVQFKKHIFISVIWQQRWSRKLRHCPWLLCCSVLFATDFCKDLCIASTSPHISLFQHVSSSCGHQHDTSVTVFEHDTPKPVTQVQQRAADSSLHSDVFTVEAHGGECSLLAEGERERER